MLHNITKCTVTLAIASNSYVFALAMLVCASQAVAVTGYAASAARFHNMAEQLSL